MASKKELTKTLNDIHDTADSLFHAIIKADISYEHKEQFFDYLEDIFDKVNKLNRN